MVLQILILLALSVMTARVLERRYKVASIAHAVLFIIVSLFYLFTVEFKPIQDMCIRWIGEHYYESLNSALRSTLHFFNGGISAILILDITLYVIVPILSIVAIVKELRERYKEIRTNQPIKLEVGYINKAINPAKDCRHILNKSYLKFCRLLN